MDSAPAGRWRQKHRTRKELLAAAARLLKSGSRPSLEAVADEAMVSRATAYRYFPSVDALLIEAALDVAVPEPETLFDGFHSADPVTRLDRVEQALHDMIAENEAPLRLMLANSPERIARGTAPQDAPVRQNRRSPLIDAALSTSELRPEEVPMLKAALAIVLGTESMVVARDVLRLDEDGARNVRRWAIRALVRAAQLPDADATA